MCGKNNCLSAWRAAYDMIASKVKTQKHHLGLSSTGILYQFTDQGFDITFKVDSRFTCDLLRGVKIILMAGLKLRAVKEIVYNNFCLSTQTLARQKQTLARSHFYHSVNRFVELSAILRHSAQAHVPFLETETHPEHQLPLTGSPSYPNPILHYLSVSVGPAHIQKIQWLVRRHLRPDSTVHIPRLTQPIQPPS